MNNMVSLNCKNCGAPLTFHADKGKCVCEHCGSEFVLGSEISTDEQFTVIAGVLKEYKGSSIYAIIPETVKMISDCCFMGLETIESVFIPASVTKIGDSAFENCKNLKAVTLPQNLEEIGNSTFKNTGLQTLILPDSLKKIGKDVFMQCEFLESALLPNNPAIKYERTFKACRALKDVYCDLDCFCKSLKPSQEAKKKGDERSTLFDAFQATPYLSELRRKIQAKTCVKCDGEIGKGGICSNCGEKYVDLAGGCYVATAVYGSYDCAEVWTLRRYRDYTLSKSWYGRAFIRIYYAISPTLVKRFGQTEWFKKICKLILDKKVGKLQRKGVQSSPYDDLPY